ESTASRCALRLAELDRRAVIGQDAHVVVFVPARQRFREGRIGRLTVGVASRDEQVADADESQGARRSGIALIKEDRWFGDREGLKMGMTNVMNAHAAYVRPNRAIARRFSRPDVLVFLRRSTGTREPPGRLLQLCEGDRRHWRPVCVTFCDRRCRWRRLAAVA